MTMRTKIKNISEKNINSTMIIKGWIRSTRTQKNFSFIAVNDGSTMAPLQVIADSSAKNYDTLLDKLAVGAAVMIEGTLVASQGGKQAFELKAITIELIGECDPETYPLQKKQHTFEFLRTIAHLRPRTNTIGAVARVRNALAFATHKFFQEQGFLYVHTPIITQSDCEGAGQMFQVTTLDLNKVPKNDKGTPDYSQDFFGRQAYLTVSGQLNGEAYACSLSDIYTFGPTFRAENSNTSRHLAEFWMIEPEMAFADLKDDMTCAENYIKYCLRYVLDNCQEDLEFFNRFIDQEVLKRLEHVVNSPFEHIPYTQAIELVQKANKKFDYQVTWGSDLQTEHERYLAEEYCKRPVIVTDYPKDIKSFYMRLNEDNKTVAAMDVLVPGVGELIGGSQREERLDVLKKRMAECNINADDYWWYMELRTFGSIPHAGFGLGFERLVQFTTGMENIRDVIPFPRSPKNLSF